MKSFIFNKDVLPGKLKAFEQYGKFVTRRTQGLGEINKEPDSHDMVEMIKTTIEGWQTVGHSYLWTDETDTGNIIIKPRYQVGEQVFIREPFRFVQGNGDSYDYAVVYNDGELKFFRDNAGIMNYPINEKIQSPYSMSEKEARYFGTVTSVRLERLQEITPKDCFLEGILPLKEYGTNTLINEFKSLWNSFAKPPLDWDSNPWVFRYEITKYEVAI